MEYCEMGWSWLPLYMTPPMVGLYASCSSIWEMTAWHRIVGVLKNLAEFGQRIEFGPWWVAIVEVTWVQTEFVADGGNIGISEWGIPTGRTLYFCDTCVLFGFCSKIGGQLGNIMCKSLVSAVPSLLNHNMYAVSVREDGGFGLTKARFHIEEKW
jgi:hypothetical protein